MKARFFANYLKRFNARQRLFISVFAGLLLFFLLPTWIFWETRLIAAWDGGILCFLFFAWFTMANTSAADTEKSTTQYDQSGIIILIFAATAAIVSILVIAFMLRHTKGIPLTHLSAHLLLSVMAIVGAWLMMHTLFAFHYAHRFYRDHREKPGESHYHTLIFPSQKPPDYLDFIYFSFIIGMTSQVSDIQIAGRSMRRLALVHGGLSFGFNMVILALSINIIAGIMSP